MNEVRTSIEAKKEILKAYNKDPKGWRVMTSRDRSGHYDLIVAHGRDVWLIKEHEVNPFKWVGYAVKMQRDEVEKRFYGPSFGIRPFNRDLLERIIESSDDGSSNFEAILKHIKEVDPVPIDKVAGLSVIQGPIISSIKPQGLISKRSMELDIRLKRELEKLLLRRYSQTILPYI